MKTSLLLFLWPIIMIPQIDVKQDKLAHFGAGAVVSSVSYSLIYKKTNSVRKSLVYSTACAFLIGTAKEVHDINHSKEGFGVEDLLVTTFGGFVTSSFITVAVKDKNKQKQLEKIEKFKNEEQKLEEIPLAVRTKN